MNLALAVFFPFAAGFFLSFLFRIVNGVIAKDLAGTFSLAPDQLGLLSSTYLLAFAAMQVPVGVFLDRYGPRRVVAALLLVAGAGSLTFALANGLATLALGRALIGVGVAACLTGAMKAFTLWYPLERLSSLNGMVIAVGGLGGVGEGPCGTPLAVRMSFARLLPPPDSAFHRHALSRVIGSRR